MVESLGDGTVSELTCPLDLEAIRARLASATPGPWKASTDDAGDVVVWGPDEDWLANVGNWARQHLGIDADAAARQFVETRDAADATLIAHAPTDLAALCDEVERLRGESDGRRRALHAERDAATKRADKAEAACAAMREALEECYGQSAEWFRQKHGSVVEAALASDAGRGWVSPEEHAKVQAQVAAMREALGNVKEAWTGRGTFAGDIVIKMIDAALACDVGKDWLSPGAAITLRAVVDQAERERDALKARVAVLADALAKAADHIDSVADADQDYDADKEWREMEHAYAVKLRGLAADTYVSAPPSFHSMSEARRHASLRGYCILCGYPELFPNRTEPCGECKAKQPPAGKAKESTP